MLGFSYLDWVLKWQLCCLCNTSDVTHACNSRLGTSFNHTMYIPMIERQNNENKHMKILLFPPPLPERKSSIVVNMILKLPCIFLHRVSMKVLYRYCYCSRGTLLLLLLLTLIYNGEINESSFALLCRIFSSSSNWKEYNKMPRLESVRQMSRLRTWKTR